MFYQLLCVPHSSSSTQSWGSVLPSIVETRDRCHMSNLRNDNVACHFILSLYSTTTQNPSRWGFTLGNTPNMLVSKKACGANANSNICVTPNESRWNTGRVGHVDFMLFVFISFALVIQRQPSFQWPYVTCQILKTAVSGHVEFRGPSPNVSPLRPTNDGPNQLMTDY